MKTKTHWHFKFMAFSQMEENGSIKLGTEITIISQENEADALHKAKTQVVRKHYWTKEVWECQSCGLYEKQVTVQEGNLVAIKDLVQEIKKSNKIVQKK